MAATIESLLTSGFTFLDEGLTAVRYENKFSGLIVRVDKKTRDITVERRSE